MRASFPLRSGALAFLAGILWLQNLAALPGMAWAGLLLPALLFACCLPGHARLLGWGLAGFVWALLQANLILRDSLPAEFEGRDLLIEGRIASLPVSRGQRQRFEFHIEGPRQAAESAALPVKRLRLRAWRGSLSVRPRAGQRWRLLVRLKRPHGLLNPGGFDYEGWLFRHRIRATGYVRKSHENQLLEEDSSGCFLLCWRAWIRERLLAATGPRETAGLLLALSIGERSRISEAQWQWLRQTGTSHLVAISGLHVGLVAGLVFLLLNRLWRLSPRLLHGCPAPRAAAFGALAVATIYAGLAGFSLPTQRALLMLGAFLLAPIAGWRIGSSRSLALALLLVLLRDPLSVMSPGFWLSFGAVALIAYGLGARRGRPGKLIQSLRAQCQVSLGLVPLSLFFFQQFSLLAPVANLLAIPLVSLLIVPLTLLGSLLLFATPDPAAALLGFAADLLAWLGAVLRWLADFPVASRMLPSPGLPALGLALAGLLWLLAPRGMPARWLGGVLLLPLLLPASERPAAGQARFTLLDVGQGLAAVVQTRSHVLVFDTGARISRDFNMAEAVLIPFLRQRGIHRIDRLVLSHADNDHLGAAPALLAQMPVDRILTSDRRRARDKGVHAPLQDCRRGQQWNWDGVRFRMLHPAAATALRRNDRSCVLQVVAGRARLLLSADIERAAETELLRRYGQALRADILVAPHHGSNTSSSAAFIDAVAPRAVLFPVGYRNRYRFPHPAVLERYRQRRIALYSVAREGALEVLLGTGTADLQPRGFRRSRGHYWNRD